MTDLIVFWYAKNHLQSKINKLERQYKNLTYKEFGSLKPLQIREEIEITQSEMNYINKRIEELENERKQYNEWRENNVDSKTGEVTYFKK